MKTIKLMAFICIAVWVLAACGKQLDTSRMRLKMTDAPGDFEQVNVEIVGVEMHYTNKDTGSNGWVALATNAGIYDLLLLQNNITTVLANESEIPAGQVNQMRLILGSKNSVVLESGVPFPLKTPSAMQSGLKINMNVVFTPDKTYEVLIDFDAGQSIVIEGNESYLLKPVIQFKSIIEL